MMSVNKAAVFILLGQSNATSHRAYMVEEDKIIDPMKNVFGLRWQENQSYDSSELVWSGYTSHSMNLGEWQDHTYSISNCLAKLWQKAVDQGAQLPDLHIIHISIGGQSLSPAELFPKDGASRDMWDPDRKEHLFPGRLEDSVDISLYPLTRHVFSLVEDSFRKMGKEYEVIGMHWRGGESEYLVKKEELERYLPGLYERFFDGLYKSLGAVPPVVLHRMACDSLMTELDSSEEYGESFCYINQVFDKLSQTYDNMSVFDVRQYPGYNPDSRTRGLFQADACHFLSEVNQWVTEQFFAEFQKTYAKKYILNGEFV